MVEMPKLAGANSPTTNAELVESLRLSSLAAPGGHAFYLVCVFSYVFSMVRACIIWSVGGDAGARGLKWDATRNTRQDAD